MRDLECPYCGEYMDEPDECNETDKDYQEQCPHCEKNFTFTVSYMKNLSSYKADCLNGAEHDYKPIVGHPKEYFENKRRCSMCSKVIILKKETLTK